MIMRFDIDLSEEAVNTLAQLAREDELEIGIFFQKLLFQEDVRRHLRWEDSNFRRQCGKPKCSEVFREEPHVRFLLLRGT